jgi:hypothetical protein
MKFFSGKTKAADAAQGLVIDFREARRNAKAAALDHDAANFRMYGEQMKTLLQVEFVDQWGKTSRVVSFLERDEVMNPYGMTPSEKIATQIWIMSTLGLSGKLHS